MTTMEFHEMMTELRMHREIMGRMVDRLDRLVEQGAPVTVALKPVVPTPPAPPPPAPTPVPVREDPPSRKRRP